MKKNQIIILIVTIVLIFGGIVGWIVFKEPKISENEAVLIINYDGEQKRAFAGQVMNDMTIIHALIASSTAGNFDFDYENGILKRIDGFKGDGKKWSVCLNGSKIQEPLNEVLIKAGDKIELKYE